MNLVSFMVTYVVWSVIILTSASTTHNDPGALDIAAFNIQIFGIKKMSNQFVKEHIVKIILRYDLILIQEIRDLSGKAIKELLREVQMHQPDYDMIVSERLGRSTSKEQYAYIFRRKWLQHVESYTFDDQNDVFEREPFIARFKSSIASIREFVVAGIHTSPSDAESEISNLTGVYDSITQRLGINDVILMGDFNAGCTYVSSWDNNKLATDKRFYWLINDKEDTTTKDTDCAYDRIVLSGDRLLSTVIPLSVEVFRYDLFYNLNDDQVTDISDHFPVQFQIASAIDKHQLLSSASLSVDDLGNNDISDSQIVSIKQRAEKLGGYQIKGGDVDNGKTKILSISREVDGMHNTINAVQTDFRVNFHDVVSSTEVYGIIRKLVQTNPLKYLPRGYGMYNTLYNYYKYIDIKYLVKLDCNFNQKLQASSSCKLEIMQSQI